MSKFFGRTFGGYKAQNKVIVINFGTIEAKKTPKCQTLVIEAIRGDRKEKTKQIRFDSGFPCTANQQVSLVSQFFVDKDKVQDKELSIKIYGCSAGKSDTVLGETTFNVAKFYDHKQKEIKLPIRDGFFTIHASVSVVETAHVGELHVDQSHISNSLHGYDGSVVQHSQTTHIEVTHHGDGHKDKDKKKDKDSHVDKA
jgi:hypothetical protein